MPDISADIQKTERRVIKIICAAQPDKSEDYGTHPLGPKILVIRSRFFSHFTLGIALLAAGSFGLYMNYIGKLDFFDRTSISQLAASYVLFIAAFIYGLYALNLITYRIVVRREGFEYRRLFRKDSYNYMNVRFSLSETVESVKDGEGFSSIFAFGNYQNVWVCRVIVPGGRKPLVFKSTRYFRLRRHMEYLLNHLTEIEFN